MFWRRKREPSGPPQIGCFGKLPATGDFIRLNASNDELASFDKWLGGAVDHAKRGMGPGFDAAYQGAVGLFIYRCDGKPGDEPGTRSLLGAWAASGDNAGRIYPMVVFASYDTGQLTAAGPALPIALWKLFASAYETVMVGRNLPVDAFVDRVSRIAPPPLDDADAASKSYRDWLTQQPVRALWDTTFGSEAPRYWALKNVIESVEPFRGQEVPKTGLAMRVPIGQGDAYAVAVWLDMTRRLGRLPKTLVSAFWTPQRSALLHIGPPHVASFRELIAPSADADHVVDLCVSPTMDEASARRALPPQVDQLLGRNDLTLAQFLDGLGN